MPNEKDLLAITGVGMVSSLGQDAKTSCAAARAGFSGAAELDFVVTDPTTNAPETIIGHQVPFVRGFEGFARLLRLADLACQDLRETVDISLLDAERCLLVVVLPEASRSTKAVGPSPVERYRNCQLSTDMSFPAPPLLLKRFARLIGQGVLPDNQLFICGGHAAFGEAVQAAQRRLFAGSLTHAILIAADSLIERHTLQWLFDHSRLKCAENAVGLAPGEAAVAILVEPQSRARSRKVTTLAVLQGVQTALDEHNLFTDAPPVGIGLSAAVTALHQALANGIETPWILSDHSGEIHRATDWGYALSSLVGKIPALREPVVTYPAISFGDTGVASGGVSLCTAVRSFARNYAPAEEGVILNSSDDGSRSALSVRRK